MNLSTQGVAPEYGGFIQTRPSHGVLRPSSAIVRNRFAGIHGELVETPDEARAALERATAMPDIGILILTDTVADTIRDEVNAVRFRRPRPLVVEVPGPTGPSPKRQDLLALIREAVGIRV